MGGKCECVREPRREGEEGEEEKVGDPGRWGRGGGRAACRVHLIALIDWLPSPALLFQIRRAPHTSGNINLQYKKKPPSIGSRKTVSSRVKGASEMTDGHQLRQMVSFNFGNYF